MALAVLQLPVATRMPENKKELSDEELACEVKAGRVASFETLVSRYEDKLYHFLKLKTNDCRDAEELTQSAFVTAFQKIQLYKPEHAFATWLFVIARRLTIDHYRSNKNRPTTNALAEEFAVHTLVENRNAADFVAESEDHSALWTSIKEILNEKQFTAMWLKYEQEMSVAEISSVMKKTKTHVKVILYRARQTLITQLPDASPNISGGFTLPSPVKS